MTESAAGSPVNTPHSAKSPAPRAFPMSAVPAAPGRPKRVRVHHLREAKERGERLTMLTAYDYPTARIGRASCRERV